MDKYDENPYELEQDERDYDKPRCTVCGRVMEHVKESSEYCGMIVYEDVYYCPKHGWKEILELWLFYTYY